VRACNLDFPALHESNFAAYFKGRQTIESVKTVKVDFFGQKSRLKVLFLNRKVDLKVQKIDFKYCFFKHTHLKVWKSKEATQNKT